MRKPWDLGPFAYGVRIGASYRAQDESLLGSPVGSEAFGTAAAGVRFGDGKGLVGPELSTSTVITGKESLFALRTTPFEALLGAHYQPTEQWRVGVGAGPGLTRGYGSPEVRTVASLEWTGALEKPPEPTKDRDADGVMDDDDACIDVPGRTTGDPKTNSCPAPKDADGDGILDDDDACPQNPGPSHTDPKKHGCPKVVVEHGRIRILERVEFETGKARILATSEEILEAVRKVLEDNPKITRVSIEGHTDSRSADAFNFDLSRRRAAAVLKWLVSHGIAADRLTSAGFGETKPIESNDTEEGRQNNRRVEFRILEEDGKPVSAEP